jgi:hypothetical protein
MDGQESRPKTQKKKGKRNGNCLINASLFLFFLKRHFFFFCRDCCKPFSVKETTVLGCKTSSGHSSLFLSHCLPPQVVWKCNIYPDNNNRKKKMVQWTSLKREKKTNNFTCANANPEIVVHQLNRRVGSEIFKKSKCPKVVLGRYVSCSVFCWNFHLRNLTMS